MNSLYDLDTNEEIPCQHYKDALSVESVETVLNLNCPKVNHPISTESVTLQSELVVVVAVVSFCFVFKLPWIGKLQGLLS